MGDIICIKHNGISYCWNYETEKIEVIHKKETIDVNDCPAEAMYKLMKVMGKKSIEEGR
jgi:hypothetical protein